MKRVLADRVKELCRVDVVAQVGGAGKGCRRGGRLLWTDEVLMVQVMVAVNLRVPQGHELSSAVEAGDGGGQRGLRGAKSGTRASQCRLGLEGGTSAQNHGLTVEKRVGGGLQNEFGALNALVLSTLERREREAERG